MQRWSSERPGPLKIKRIQANRRSGSRPATHMKRSPRKPPVRSPNPNSGRARTLALEHHLSCPETQPCARLLPRPRLHCKERAHLAGHIRARTLQTDHVGYGVTMRLPGLYRDLLGGVTDEHAGMSNEFVDRAFLQQARLSQPQGLACRLHRVAGTAIDSTPAPRTSWWTAIPSLAARSISATRH